MATIRSRSSAALALALMLAGGCDGGQTAAAGPSTPSKTAPKQGQKTMSWTDVARLTEMIPKTRVDESVTYLKARPADVVKRAEVVLAQMAGTAPDAAGIDQAMGALRTALPTFADPNWDGSGEQPNVAALKQCSLVLLHGLLARAGHAAAKSAKPDDAAVALLAAQRRIDGFRPEILTEFRDELMNSLGDLYDAAETKLGPVKPK